MYKQQIIFIEGAAADSSGIFPEVVFVGNIDNLPITNSEITSPPPDPEFKYSFRKSSDTH